MSTPGYLPSASQASAMTDEAVELSGDHADPGWLESAESLVRWLAGKGASFSANDVWQMGQPFPANRRSLGYVFRLLSAEGVIASTGEKVTSRWGHGGQITVWRRP